MKEPEVSASLRHSGEQPASAFARTGSPKRVANRLRTFVLLGACLCGLGIVLCANGAARDGGILLVVGWITFGFAIHALGRSGPT